MASLWFFSRSAAAQSNLMLWVLSSKRSEFYRSLNASFIVTIPKKEGVASIGDYRPISVVESIYKIISKVLSNRFKKVLDEILSS